MKARKSLRRCFALTVAGAACMLGACARGGSGKPDKDVLAEVNGYKIVVSEVDKNYQRQITEAAQKPTMIEEEALRLTILSQMISAQLYLQQAKKLGIAATNDEVESRFGQIKAPYTPEEFQKKLVEVRLTEEDSKRQIRRDLTIQKLFEKEIASKVTITDADIQSYYDGHKSDFNLKDARGQRDLNDPEVQQFVRKELRNQLEQVLRAAYDASLRDDAKIHNYYAEQILKSRSPTK